MTAVSTETEALDPIEAPQGETTFPNKSDGKTSHEHAASTDAGQPLKPSDDNALFNNMPR
jgi:hypothetical protein